MTSFYNQEFVAVLSQLRTSADTGLPAEEVKKRLEEYGYNQLIPETEKHFFRCSWPSLKAL